nr:MAG: hypothetical protein KatS3mg041_0694 [Bacteroidota bacterium]
MWRLVSQVGFLVWGIGLFACGACAQVPAPPPWRPELTAGEFFYHVRVLASDSLEGREAGTAGAHRAARYLAGQFARLGLWPLGTDSARGPAGLYGQPFSFVRAVRAASGRSSLSFAGRRYTEQVRPAWISASGQVSGPLLWVGYGLVSEDPAWNDYEGLDVTGAVVLMLEGYPRAPDPHAPLASAGSLRRKVETAAVRGAAAVVVLRDSLSDATPALDPARLSPVSIPVLELGPRAAAELLADLELDGGRLRQEAERGARGQQLASSVRVEVELERELATDYNLIGFWPGQGPNRDEVLLIGAHYDHLGWGGPASLAPGQRAIHYGADDNASGVAALLELAGYWTARVRNRSALFIAFGAEEKGLIGSAHFVRHPPSRVPAQSWVAMLNLDMVGRLRDGGLILHGTGTSPVWPRLLESALRGMDTTGLRIRFVPGGQGPSDHASFYAQGVPVLHAFTGTHSDYHRPTDRAERIDTTGARRVLEVLARILDGLDTLSVRPAFTPTADPNPRTAVSFRVSLGVLPDYGYSGGDGLRITGVSEGRPAARAGLRAGDLIVRIGAYPVRDIYDYMQALSRLRPGDRVEIELIRQGQRLRLEVQL